jgi:multidrug efflux pump
VAAALEGTQEIAFAALAATLAVVAIFIPVVFVKGIIGRFFLQFGITLCLAVLLSYVEAVTLAPARCSQFLRTSREGRSRLGHMVDQSFRWLEKTYGRVLRSTLGRPWLVLGSATLLFGLALLVLTSMPSEFVPSQDVSRLSIRLQTAVGSDISEASALIQKAEDVVARRPEVQEMFTNVGGYGGGVNGGSINATLVEPRKRKLSQARLSTVLRRELNSLSRGSPPSAASPSSSLFADRTGISWFH